MSGRIDLLTVAIVALAVLASVTDLARGKIYNWLTIPAIVLGLGYSAWSGGWQGLESSAIGIALGFALYGWMFLLGYMGAGDVKLLMAFGAWGGIRYTWQVALLGVVLGGLMAAAILLFKGRLLSLAKRIYHFLQTVFIWDLEIELPKVDRKLTMPYGLPIAVAALWIQFGNPFGFLAGMRLW